ncbi:MAG TPA: MoxR family ATPase [Steroidobacteraceae bacterium]|nr:MoxR family ATPase [Steroidobacteraceae bacterium]
MTEATSSAAQRLDEHLQSELGRVVLGLATPIRMLTIALLARGHVLIEGAPGLGKTLLSKSLARALGGVFKRIQGTADLMPSDITGVHVFDSAKQSFVFRPGPLFADVVLADEINRAGPKTQSALLEAMEERQVTVERDRFGLPPDFMVIATQNPREFEGTFPLPESQLDRFMLRIVVEHPQRDAETQILQRYGALATGPEPVATVNAIDRAAIEQARAEAAAVHVSESLVGYVLDLVRASREHAQVTLGVSTRGALALLRGARIAAALRGAEFVAPDDVKELAPAVLAHRLLLTPEAALDNATGSGVIAQILEQTPVPK